MTERRIYQDGIGSMESELITWNVKSQELFPVDLCMKILESVDDGYSADQDNMEVENLLNAAMPIENPTNLGVLQLGRKAINSWIVDSLVDTIPSKYARNFIMSKMHLDPQTLLLVVNLVSEVVETISQMSRKNISDLALDSFVDPRPYQFVASRNRDRFRIGYLNQMYSFWNPFRDGLDLKLDQKIRHEFSHPVIDQLCTNMRRKGIKELSILNDVMVPAKHVFSWLQTNIRMFSDFEPQEIPVALVESVHLIDYRLYLLGLVRQGRFTSNGAKQRLRYVKRIFSYAYHQKLMSRDISQDVPNISANNYKNREIPSIEEIQRLINVVWMYSDQPKYDVLAYLLMLGSGLRGIDVVRLRWSDFNMGTHTVSVTGKGDKTVIIPMPAAVYAHLTRIGVRRNGFVFEESPTKMLSKMHLDYKLYARISGWDYPGGLHLLRHTFVTRIAELTGDPDILRILARHESLITVSNYLHTKRDALKSAINTIKF